jgi:hypothetical protein
MASAGVAVGAIMAISPVFAQGTTPSSPSNGDTLLASILAAVHAAGVTLTAEQTKELADVVKDITSTPATVETEDEDEDDDDDTAVAAAATTHKETTKKTITITFTPKSSEKSGEEKGDD